MAARAQRPHAVLFACRLNAIRSPIAEAIMKHLFASNVYVRSAGVLKGEVDTFAAAVLDEIGLDLQKHRPHTFEDIEELEGLSFDLIVTLAPEAHHKALELTRATASEVEYWPTPDPSDVGDTRERRLEAYRQVRDMLMKRIKERFDWRPSGSS